MVSDAVVPPAEAELAAVAPAPVERETLPMNLAEMAMSDILVFPLKEHRGSQGHIVGKQNR